MNNYYCTLGALLLLPTLLFSQPSSTKPEKQQLPADVPESWYAKAIKGITASEYNIAFSETDCGLRSHNRQNNFYVGLQGSGFTIQPKGEDENPINFSLNGIYANAKRALKADVRGYDFKDKNNLVFWHHGFKEQYINSPEGLRQNFIIEEDLHTDEIKVLLTITGAILSANGGNAVHLRTVTGTEITYADLNVWDAKGNKLPAHMQLVNKNQLALVVQNTQHAAYPITIDPLSTTPATTLESNQANSNLGYSVASAGDVNGDGYSDVIVGAYTFDKGQNNEGAAFVYHGSASGINTTAAATLESNQENANLGRTVASAGDVNGDGYSDVIVGAPSYDGIGTDEGAAFVYHGSASGINTTAAWQAQGSSDFTYMGWSVASAGDVNGDGYSDVIVGAPYYKDIQTNEGAAYAYLGSAQGLALTAIWQVESNQAAALLGYSVASAGDVNGDGYSDVIVGAWQYDNGENNEGAAFVYHGSPSGINTTAATTLESNQASAYLGHSVASAGDVNGDGYSDVIVGAYYYDNGETNEGAAFVYHGSASGISTTAAATLESNQENANLGRTVASAGDVNGDGYSDVIVGAPSYDGIGTDEGAAFVYHGSASGINTTAAWQAQGSSDFTYMGWSVASAGDVNGDGYSDVIVGAYLYDNGQTDEGAAFVYYGSADIISLTPTATLESNQASAYLGYSVASAGDVNGDGYSDVIVGAYLYDNGETNEGAAFVYHGSASGISTTAAATLESNQVDASLGWSVASAGDVNGDGYSDVIVGASFYDNGQLSEGAAFVYHGSPSGINTTANATVESNQFSAVLGWSVASAGDVNGDGYSDVIVGAIYYTNGQTNEGAAFVYHGSASGINTTAAATLESNQASAYLGNSVASAGDVNGDGYSDVIVGARLYDNGQTDEGAAFVYHGSASGINTTAAATLESNQDNAGFGWSVASAGDVNGDGYSDVIVGAIYYDNGETNEGAAFVYHGSPSGISNTAAWQVESNQIGAETGRSVASAGDVNGDGYGDVIVGAHYYDNGETNEGAAFVYHGSPSGINTTANATVESNQVSAYLGTSVASAGDVNGDGYSDVIVGAYRYDNGQTNEGAAFVYYGSADIIRLTPTATLESNQADAEMGWSVASAGDVNGDGFSDVIVGVRYYDNGTQDEGGAFVYHGNANGLNTTPAAILESNLFVGHMGESVASAGDVNGDGYSDVIVGAQYYDNGETDEGAAFIYHGSASGINTTAVTTIEGGQAYANLGVSVASAGDVNGDGYSDVIVGAFRFDNAESDEGAAFIFYGSANGINAATADTLEENQIGAYMGWSVASAGDVNGDGYSDVIVGANYYDNGENNEGAAFVYHGSASGINTTATASLESNQASARMGESVASAGDVNGDGYSDIVIGAARYRNGQTYEGAVFVYHGSASGISTTAATTLESNQVSAFMGGSVASAGDINGDGYSDVIVGAYGYDNVETNEGAAFIYYGSAIGVNSTPAAKRESNQYGAYMGMSVANAGDVNGDGYSDVLMGAPFYNKGQDREGAAFVYYGNGGGGLRQNVQALDEDLTNAYTTSGLCDAGLGMALFNKSPMGRVKGAVQLEAISQGQAWGSGTVTTSTLADLGIAGVNQKLAVNYLNATVTKVRIRQVFDKTTALDGRIYGPWRYLNAAEEHAALGGFYGGDVIVWDGAAWCKGSGTANAPAVEPTKRLLIHGTNAALPAYVEVDQLQISWPNNATLNAGNILTVNTSAKNYNPTAGSFVIAANNSTGNVGSYIGPQMENAELQYGIAAEGWHNLSIPFAINVAAWQAQNATGTVAITGVETTQNLHRYNTTYGSGSNNSSGSGGYSSVASGSWQLPDGTEVLNNSGYNFFIDGYFGGVPQTVVAQGTTQDATFNFPLYNANGGWNMVPNPYPATLDLDALYWDNSSEIDPGVFIWDAANDNLVAIDASTGLAVHPDLGVNANGTYVAAGQAFYVRPTDYSNVAEAANSTVTTTTKTLSITPSHRIAIARNLYKTDFVVGLKATHGVTNKADQLAIAFDPSYTDDFTRNEDIAKFFSDAEDATHLFATHNSKAMAIAKYQTPVAETTIPVGFSATQNGTVEIQLTAFPEGWSVWLKDYKTGAIKNLNTGNYNFVNEPAFGPDRFALVISKTAVDLKETNGIGEQPLVYAANGNLLINMNGSTGNDVTITMLDATGRVVYYTEQNEVSTDFIQPLTLKTGVYMVRIENKTSGNVYTEKLFW